MSDDELRLLDEEPEVHEDEGWMDEWLVPPSAFRRVDLSDMPYEFGQELNNDGSVAVQGTTLFPFEGQTMWLLRTMSLGTAFSTAGLVRDQGNQLTTMRHFEALCARLADLLAHWTLTDLQGRLMPQPYGNPEALERLTADQINWIMGKVMVEDEAAEGKGGGAGRNSSRPSRSTTRTKGMPRQRR
jgi:hypothetical protein